MKLTIKTLASAAAGLGFLFSMTADADACGGRGGGGYRGSFGGHRANYNYNYYPQQQYQQAYCPPQPQYQQYPQQPFPQQQVPQQQFPQQQLPQQQVQQFPQQQQVVPQGQAAPVAQNGVAAPQTRVVAKPVSTAGTNVVGTTPAPVAAAPQAAPAQPADGSAEMSALQALSGWDGSEQPAAQAEATTQAGFNPIGDFVATLASGATVRLRMSEDGSFTWIATNKGKNTSFQGSYTLDGGSLKLLRSNDNQKLEGAFGQTQNGFSFKLSGQTETNLSFVRS